MCAETGEDVVDELEDNVEEEDPRVE